MARAKKILWWALFAFLIYAVVTSPDKAADIIRTAWSIIVNAVNAILHFFNSLLNGR